MMYNNINNCLAVIAPTIIIEAQYVALSSYSFLKDYFYINANVLFVLTQKVPKESSTDDISIPHVRDTRLD